MSENVKAQLTGELKDEEKIWGEAVDLRGINEKTKKIIEDCVRNPKNFLGEGGAGKVFIFETHCIKMIRVIEKYHGISPAAEFNIQWKVRNLNVGGVYAPKVISFAQGDKCAAIIMERLSAVNLLLVLQGKEALPINFDLDLFFDRLDRYLDSLHELDIIHNDLYARNIMIDIRTGLPRVIDFGNAIDFSEYRPADFEIKADTDYRLLNEAREQTRQHLDKLRNT